MKIHENSYISVGVVFVLLGGMFWLSAQSAMTATNSSEISGIKTAYATKVQDDQKFQVEVLQRLARIESKLENKEK